MNSFAIIRLAVLSLLFSSVAFADEEFVVPIGASSPHVFLSLTDERDATEGFFSIPSASTQAEGLPLGRNAHYQVAIYDTGSPATIISRDVFEQFDIAGAGLDGTNVTPIGGVGELVDAINSDPLGVYAAGLDALLTNPVNGQQIVDRARLRGSFNDPILYGTPGTSLPNVVGTNTSMNYVSLISYSEPRIVDFEGETYRSPNISLADIGTVPRPDRRIGLTLEPGQLGSTSGAWLPDFGGIGSGGDITDNPSTPSIGGSFWLKANVRNNGVERNQLEAILDTGAQASIVSETIAAELGFDVINDKPDFFVHIAGVTGISEEVPGFYADEFHLPGTDGGLRLNNVPLIVFNLTDPRDGINTLDALIGMNVFSGRDIILDPELGSPYLGISDTKLPSHTWNAAEASGDWNTVSNWSNPGFPSSDWFATVRNTTNEPRFARINEDSSIAKLVVSGNADTPDATMTVSIAEGKRLGIFGTAVVQSGGVIEVNGGELDAFGVELRAGTLAGFGRFTGEISSQGNIIPGGTGAIGTMTFFGNVDMLSQGTLQIELGDNSDGSNLQHDRVILDDSEIGFQQLSLDGKLEITTTDAYVQPESGNSDQITVISAPRMIGEFAEYSFDGTPLEAEFTLSADRRSFRDHIGNGQFITVSYLNQTTVSVVNEQAMLGDTNGDGQVQFDDFIAVADNFGLEADWTGGDFTNNGIVDFLDFVALANNFGRVAGAAAALSAVPEPSGAMLFGIGLAVFGSQRRRRAWRTDG